MISASKLKDMAERPSSSAGPWWLMDDIMETTLELVRVWDGGSWHPIGFLQGCDRKGWAIRRLDELHCERFPQDHETKEGAVRALMLAVAEQDPT